MTSTLRREPFEVTQEAIDAYKKIENPMFCGFCGENFSAGDIARFQYVNHLKDVCGNFHVCQKCDEGNDKNIDRYRNLIAEWKSFKKDKKFRHVRSIYR